jgi:hypothetical protein
MPLTITNIPTVTPTVGHVSRVNLSLTEAQRTRLQLIVQGLRNAGATHSSGLPVLHEADAIRWLLENGTLS